VGPPGGLQWPAISPDGKTVAVDRDDTQGGIADVWLYDLSHNTNSRFTLGPQNNRWPVWSPDAGHIAYYTATFAIKQRATSGTTPDEVLDEPGARLRTTDWSRDGRYIFEERLDDPKTQSDVWVLPTFGDKKPFAYLNGEFNERLARLSPNGQWLAYQSDESKRNEIVVETFPKRGGKWSVSNGGGTRPVWSRDGKELFFVSADHKMMAVEVRGGANFERGTPRALFDVRLDDGAFFDVGKDGKFLIPTLVEQPAVVPMTVVINWAAGLKKN
jgi:Tol biopolymer transport system component